MERMEGSAPSDCRSSSGVAVSQRRPSAARTHQQVLVDLHVAVVVGQMRRAVQRREAAVVALVDDLRAVADDVVQLRDAASAARMQELASPPGARAPRTGGWSAFLQATVSSAASHHVQLLVRRREVHGRAGAVVLAPEIRVRVHDLRGHGEAQRGAEQSGCRRVQLGAEDAPASAARSRRGGRRSRRRRAGSAAAAESARCLRALLSRLPRVKLRQALAPSMLRGILMA